MRVASLSREQRYRRRRLLRKLRQKRYYERHKKRLISTLRARSFDSYDGFVKAMVARRKQLGWSMGDLDDRAGFPDGYTQKLENWQSEHGRVAGHTAMTLWLQALGISFVPVPTEDGSIREQVRKLLAVDRPKLNGAQMQKAPARRNPSQHKNS